MTLPTRALIRASVILQERKEERMEEFLTTLVSLSRMLGGL